MRKNPERLAWIVLLLSFFTCVGLAVGVPLGIRHYVLYAYVGQNVTLEVQRGPLRVTLAGRGEPVAIAEERDDIPERTIVATDSTAGRLVMHADGSVIATVQIYDDTEVVLSSARSPRFSSSHLPHKVTLEVKAGRVRINLSSDDGRQTVAEVHTPHGAAALTEGSYEVKVNGTTTEVIVRDGQAGVTNGAGPVVSLGPAERATVDDEQIIGPLPAARNLILNSDFAVPLEEGWGRYSVDPQVEGESRGEVRRAEIEGRPVIVIERSGVGHAETGITQMLNADIGDSRFLELHLLLRIEEHNVPVCGSEGSECPVMVRIVYQDAYGADREWLQGFYSLPNTGGSNNPSVCIRCSTRNQHLQVPQGTWYAYASPNLIPLLSQDGQAPTAIKSITVYASGHTYQSAITEVELIGQE